MVKKRLNNKHRFLKFIGRIFTVFVIATVSIVLYDLYANIDIYNSGIIMENVIGESKTEDENVVYDNIEKVASTVVGISKLQSVDSSFFSLEVVKNYNLGTGVIISKKGYVITNYHVCGNKNTKCYVTTEDGTKYTAKAVWIDESLDLGIIKINTTREMECAVLGDSENLRIGQPVYAIGNPLGVEFQRTVTYGIISALDRTIKLDDESGITQYMNDLIQIDAAINNGNSGGPLIDRDGNVIGINSIKINDAEGLGFAIPINVIKPLIEKLENDDGCVPEKNDK